MVKLPIFHIFSPNGLSYRISLEEILSELFNTQHNLQQSLLFGMQSQSDKIQVSYRPTLTKPTLNGIRSNTGRWEMNKVVPREPA
ncbi:hypothetical protein AVEN_234294-1 [Araneus ventricosus]|uniref:Uncharacterized protein n=1 Tax=Araneus ventricosus TaxID=182803 RepID=A0A4Y2A9E5_ARAVE|nr:hypothetical protein AVEN_234294-1 [Araneus ventricosus]